MLNDRLGHLLAYVPNFPLSSPSHLRSLSINLVVDKSDKRYDSPAERHVPVPRHSPHHACQFTPHRSCSCHAYCCPPIPPAAEVVAPACARVVAPSSLTARRHKCSSICYSHHRLAVVDVCAAGGTRTSQHRPAPVPHRAALAARHTTHHGQWRRAGRRRLQRRGRPPSGELGPSSPLYSPRHQSPYS